MNKNHKIGIITATIAVVLISIPVYLYWMYSPEAVYRRGLASAFWLSLENDARDITVTRGETKIVPVELHHWKDLDTALYVELRSDDGSSTLEKYPSGLSVSFDRDSSVISLSKGAIMVLSKNEAAKFNPPMIKQVSADGQMVVREIGNLAVSASKDVPLGSYYFDLSTGDTKINGGGGNGQLLTVTVVDYVPEENNGSAPAGNENKIATGVECQQFSLCTYQLQVGSSTYPINFRMNGTIENMTADMQVQTLTIQVKVERPASLQIALPREVIDSRTGADGRSGADDDFAVFIDEENVTPDEFSTKESEWAQALGITEHPEKYRILVIPIPEGSERVDIVGTWLI